MIAQSFVFTRGFPKEWNNSVYFRLSKIPCGFKEKARAHQSGEKCGFNLQQRNDIWNALNTEKRKKRIDQAKPIKNLAA